MSSTVKIRRLALPDLEGMWKLCSDPKTTFIDTRNIGLHEFEELWHHRWNIKEGATPQHVLGWVLDHSEEGIVGFIGNIPVSWWLNKKEIEGFAATSWIVDPRFRVRGVRLFQKFFVEQKNFFLLDTTANPIAAKVCEKDGALPIPLPAFGESLLWEIKPVTYYYRKLLWFYQYVKETGKAGKKNIYLIKLLKVFPGFGLLALVYGAYRAIVCIGQRGFPSHYDSTFQVEQCFHFGEEFDKLWEKFRDRVGSTMVRRSSSLNWRHFCHPSAKGKTYALKILENGELKGYIAFKEMGSREDVSNVFHVTDLFYDFNEINIAKALLSSAYEFSKTSLKAVAFVVSDLRPELMEYLKKVKPRIKRIEHCTYWYKSPQNGYSLTDQNWWPSRIDGDLNL